MRVLMILALALSGCASLVLEQRHSEEQMMTMAAALTKVSAATEANLRYGTPSDPISDSAFLDQSVAHDPGLLTAFSTYRIKTMRYNGHTANLVCSQDGTSALLEDAGCTAAMDKHRWREEGSAQCVFTLDLLTLCPAVRN